MDLFGIAEELEEHLAGDREGENHHPGGDAADDLLILDLLAEQPVDHAAQQGKEWDEPEFVVHLFLL